MGLDSDADIWVAVLDPQAPPVSPQDKTDGFDYYTIICIQPVADRKSVV